MCIIYTFSVGESYKRPVSFCVIAYYPDEFSNSTEKKAHGRPILVKWQSEIGVMCAGQQFSN